MHRSIPVARRFADKHGFVARGVLSVSEMWCRLFVNQDCGRREPIHSPEDWLIATLQLRAEAEGLFSTATYGSSGTLRVCLGASPKDDHPALLFVVWPGDVILCGLWNYKPQEVDEAVDDYMTGLEYLVSLKGRRP